ncbi:MAG: DUF3791 domain-containing protein [Oscillospiraceae bacterium]|nr:DUF3791 domain-containing protein [Oscillospiraceae bacterium]
MLNNISPVLRFMVFYINEFSKVIGRSNDVGYKVLLENGILDYLEDCYEPLHTQGRLYVLTDIIEMLISKGYFPESSTPFDIIPEYAYLQPTEG